MKEWKELKNDYSEIKMTDAQVENLKKAIEQTKEEKKQQEGTKVIAWRKYAVAAAAAVAIFVALPNTSADVAHAMEKVPGLGKIVTAVTIREYRQDGEKKEKELNAEVESLSTVENDENLKKTTEEINADVDRLTKEYIAAYEKELAEEGYLDVEIFSKVVVSTEDYFTLKLSCETVSASSDTVEHYYTIDLHTGKLVQLSDMYASDVDYKKIISDEVKRQMRAQMKENENLSYWLDNGDFSEDNFTTISDDVNFYINEEGKVVIVFAQGEVAPMYMGCPQFVMD